MASVVVSTILVVYMWQVHAMHRAVQKPISFSDPVEEDVTGWYSMLCRSRRRQWVAGMRPDGEAALARRLPVDVAQQRRMDLSGEDDRLLMCLLAEFGEASPTLVAEVFSSIRRLDGVHMDRNIVVSRVRC